MAKRSVDIHDELLIGPEEEATSRRLMSAEEVDDIEVEEFEDDADVEEVDAPLIRKRRSMKFVYQSHGKSPISVKNARNYNPKENSDWVKPAFSTIVYRLGVCYTFAYHS